jgi:hypothetical protein
MERVIIATGRRRQRPEEAHVHAHAGEARDQRRLDHIARQPGVLADHHQVAPVASALEQLARRHADAQRHLGGHGVAVGLSPHAVGSEVGSLHRGHALHRVISPVLIPPGDEKVKRERSGRSRLIVLIGARS